MKEKSLLTRNKHGRTMNESRLLPSLRIVIYRGRRMVAHSVAFDIRPPLFLFQTFEFRASESVDHIRIRVCDSRDYAFLDDDFRFVGEKLRDHCLR